MTASTGEGTPPVELCDRLRAAADRLLAGTPLRSDGKLTIVSLCEEAGVKRWLLTHKYPHQLKDKYQAEFKAAQHKSAPVRAVESELVELREKLTEVREDNRRLIELNKAYALMITQLAEELDDVTSQRDALKHASSVTRLPHRSS